MVDVDHVVIAVHDRAVPEDHPRQLTGAGVERIVGCAVLREADHPHELGGFIPVLGAKQLVVLWIPIADAQPYRELGGQPKRRNAVIWWVGAQLREPAPAGHLAHLELKGSRRSRRKEDVFVDLADPKLQPCIPQRLLV